MILSHFKCVKFQKAHNLMIPCLVKHMKRLESAYHACKCLRSYLEQFVCDKPTYKGKGKLTKLCRMKIDTPVRWTIKMQ